MKRVVAKAGRAIIIDVPEPELRPGEVLVATAFSAISSGTEMHIIHSTANPETLGDDTYPRKPSLQYPAPPQLRSRGVRWAGPEPRGQIPETICPRGYVRMRSTRATISWAVSSISRRS